MIFKNKNVVRKIFFIILLIFISIIVFWLGMYAKFYYSMYYGGGVYIDSYVDQTSDSRLWIGLPGMEKYCREEGYEKGDVNCKPIILAVDEAVNTKNNSTYHDWKSIVSKSEGSNMTLVVILGFERIQKNEFEGNINNDFYMKMNIYINTINVFMKN